MLRSRRIQMGCVVAASALTLFSVHPSLVLADAESVAPPLAIAVPIGGEARASVQFAVPAIVRTDLAALVDTTGSGAADLGPIAGAFVSAIDATQLSNPSFRVGVATSGEVPVFPFGTATDVPYQLKAPMSAVRAEWTAAIAALQAVEGGGDVKEGQLVALGELLKSTSADPTLQAVALDPTARRIVIVSTDSAPHVDTDSWCNGATCVPYPGPSVVGTQAMLDQAGVTMIVLGRGDVGALRTIAESTGGTVVDVSSPSRIAALTDAIAVAPITVRPTLTGCEGLTVRTDQATVRARPGETVTVPVVIAAAAGLVEGQRTCGLEFAGLTQTVTITAGVPCDSEAPTSSTTPSSTTVAGSASTTTPEGTATTVPEGTATTVTSSIAPDPATTTSAVPATTTSAVPATTTEPATTTSAVPVAPAVTPTVPSDNSTTTSPSANDGSTGEPVVPTPTTEVSAAGPSVPVVSSTAPPAAVVPVVVSPGQCVPVTTVPATTVPVPVTTVPGSTATTVPGSTSSRETDTKSTLEQLPVTTLTTVRD